MSQTVKYTDNAQGQIIAKTTSINNGGGPVDQYLTFAGVRRGDVGNNGAPSNQLSEAQSIKQATTTQASNGWAYGSATSYANFDQNFAPVDPASTGQAQAPQAYTAVAGDTLQSVAQNLWGDSSLWYLIADANGLSDPNQTLAAGTLLTAPADVVNVHNSASTSQVYNQYQTMGNVNPDQIAPHPKHCNGVFGQIIGSIVAVIVTAITGLPILAPLVADLAGQAFNLADGAQSKFNWKSVGMDVVQMATSFIPMPAIGDGASVLSDFINPAVQQVERSVLNQGIDVTLGLQHKMDWTSVAVAGVEAGVNAAGVNNGFGAFGSAALAGLAGAGLRALLTHKDFGQSLLGEIPSVIDMTFGNYQAEQEAQQAAAAAGPPPYLSHEDSHVDDPGYAPTWDNASNDGASVAGYSEVNEGTYKPAAFGAANLGVQYWTKPNGVDGGGGGAGSIFTYTPTFSPLDDTTAATAPSGDATTVNEVVITARRDAFFKTLEYAGGGILRFFASTLPHEIRAGFHGLHTTLNNIADFVSKYNLLTISLGGAEALSNYLHIKPLATLFHDERKFVQGFGQGALKTVINVPFSVGGYLNDIGPGGIAGSALNQAGIHNELGDFGNGLKTFGGMANGLYQDSLRFNPLFMWGKAAEDAQTVKAQFVDPLLKGDYQGAGNTAGSAAAQAAVVLLAPEFAPEAKAAEEVATGVDRAVAAEGKAPDVPDTPPAPTPSGDPSPGSDLHKSTRWKEYQDNGGTWDYDRWSKVYDGNMTRAAAANDAVNAYHQTLGWGEREVTVNANIDGVDYVRRLDIADVATLRGVEYKIGYQTATKDNLWEVARDQALVKSGWDVQWVFRDAASQPLQEALNRAGIKFKIGK